MLIEVEKRGPSKTAVDGVEVIATHKGDVIELEVKRPRSESFSGIGMHRTAYARLSVWVPKSTNVRARSGDGAITMASDAKIQVTRWSTGIVPIDHIFDGGIARGGWGWTG